MSYVKPDAVLDQMVQAGVSKAWLARVISSSAGSFLPVRRWASPPRSPSPPRWQTKVGLVGGLVFPVGFVMIVPLGLAAGDRNFALLPP